MSFFTIRLESLFIVLGIAKKASWGNRWGSILELISSNHALELIKGRVYLHAFDCLFITINPWHIHLAPSPVSRYNKAWRAVCTGVSSLALLVYLLVFIIHILPGQILPLTHPWFVWLSYLRWDVLSASRSFSSAVLYISSAFSDVISELRAYRGPLDHSSRIRCWDPACAVLVSVASCRGHLRNNRPLMGLYVGFDLGFFTFWGHGESVLVKLI